MAGTFRGPNTDPRALGAVAAGAVLGASARYGVARALPVRAGAFPWATFLTNVGGSFAIGVVLVVVVERLRPTRYLRPFLATGVLGGFTTFSTMAVEGDLLVRGGRAGLAVAYWAASLAGGVAAAAAGAWAARSVPPRRRA